MMDIISPEEQKILDCLTNAIAEALERKRRLGQYAVVWRDGQPVILEGESLLLKPTATRPVEGETHGKQ
ncbi:MAG: hypothetical protein DM484_15500 [Candidatus Methylumidiphilus alinenensis]|uniref:Uncharacterized protein n=1 Tax=Candidatus Methylumidiphilus alinenensis TaxID=2202197 RepID=A0A2W4R432_9GAMM|nr:MAG: hypothetical protein DM484_15500 [Candidatus Methylumidiphilus alinenensis]